MQDCRSQISSQVQFTTTGKTARMTSTCATSSVEFAGSISSPGHDRRTLPTRSHPHHCGIMAFGGPSHVRGLTRRRMQHTPHSYFNMSGGLPNTPTHDASAPLVPARPLANWVALRNTGSDSKAVYLKWTALAL